MKKNLIIVLLSVVSVASIAFGYYQKVRADDNEALAQLNERLAGVLGKQVEEVQGRTKDQQSAAAMDREQMTQTLRRLEEEIRKCKRTKR